MVCEKHVHLVTESHQKLQRSGLSAATEQHFAVGGWGQDDKVAAYSLQGTKGTWHSRKSGPVPGCVWRETGAGGRDGSSSFPGELNWAMSQDQGVPHPPSATHTTPVFCEPSSRLWPVQEEAISHQTPLPRAVAHLLPRSETVPPTQPPLRACR